MKKLVSIICLFIFLYKIRTKIIIFALLILSPPNKLSESMNEKYSIYSAVSQHINKKYYLNGGMVGSYNNLTKKKVEGLCFIFRKKGKILQDEAREILIKILLEVLWLINQKQNHAKYFFPYPFTTMNLDLSIIFYNKYDANHELEPYIGDVIFTKNKLIFSKYSFFSKEGSSWCSREPFEEAFEKVKKSLPHELKLVGENSIQRIKERDLDDANTNKEDSDDDELSIDKWHELAIAPRDSKGYLIPKK